MLSFGVCYQITLPETGKPCNTLLAFPENPLEIKGGDRPIQILATTIMTPQLLAEMLDPTDKVVSLAELARTQRHPLAGMRRVRVMGYDYHHAVQGYRAMQKLFLSYTLFGIDEDLKCMCHIRVYPTKADLPDVLHEILPPARDDPVPNIYSMQADMYLDKCVGCADAPPLGADRLCARCLLLNEL